MAKRRRLARAFRIGVFSILLLTALIRFRLRDMPLERDEGEYAYAGQLLLQGIPPYQLAYNMKLPGTYAAYAAILAVFGESPAAIHVGLLLVNAATTLLIALLARRLLGHLAGVCAGAGYAVLSTSPSVLGLSAHATHFVVLPAVAGVLLLVPNPDSRTRWRVFASGALLGLAALMKQPGLAFVLFGAACLAGSRPPPRWSPNARRELLRELLWFACGAAAPFGITLAWLVRAGVFARFRFWVFSYGSQYGSAISPADGLFLLLGTLPGVVGACVLVWATAAAGVFAMARDGRIRRRAFFLVSFAVCSFLAVSAGLHFRSHYFILLLPAVALLAGAGVAAARRAAARRWPGKAISALPVAAFSLALGVSLFLERDCLFRMTPADAARTMYGGNPFAEAVEVARYLRSHTTDGSRIAVFGSEPEIYFYARRRSATGYIYTYGLMEPQKYAHRMQQEMIAEIERAAPEFFVYVRSPLSWLRNAASDTSILAWADGYLSGAYEAVDPQPAPEPGEIRIYRRKPLAATFALPAVLFTRLPPK